MRLVCRASVLTCFALAAPPVSSQSVTVGPNIQVSKDNSTSHHRELWASAHPTNPDRLIACADVYGSPDGSDDRRQEIFYVSDDRGKTWRETLRLDPHRPVAGYQRDDVRYGDEVCEFGPGGRVYAFVAASVVNEKGLLFQSADGGMTWERPTPFPFWDRDAFAIDNTSGKFHGRIYVLSNQGAQLKSPLSLNDPKSVDAFAPRLYRSEDGGRTFVGPTVGAFRGISAARDEVLLGRYFPGHPGYSPAVLSDGTLIAPYLEAIYGTLPRTWERPWRGIFSYGTLSIIRSTDGGKTLEPETIVATITDKMPSECRYPALAADPGSAYFKDRVYVLWCDASSHGSRILLSYSTDKGKTWSAPRRVDDTRPRADGTFPKHVHPLVKVNRDGVVGVSWYDKREVLDDIGWDMRFAASTDGGETFSKSVRVSEKTSLPRTTDLHRSYSGPSYSQGKHGVAVSYRSEPLSNAYDDSNGMAVGADGTFHPMWVDLRTGVSQMWTAAVRVGGIAVAHGARELATLVDVSDKVRLIVSHVSFDRKTGVLEASYRVRNSSSDTLRGPLKLRLVSLDFGVNSGFWADVRHVATRGSDNGVAGVGAVWDFTAQLDRGTLAPGAVSQQRRLTLVVTDLEWFGRDGKEREILAYPLFRVLAGSTDRGKAP